MPDCLIAAGCRYVHVDAPGYTAYVDEPSLAQMRARGEDPFRTWQLPDAAITLRQGFGRLIRSREDVGVVAILDPRMHSRGYGRSFLRSLPPAHPVRSHAELSAWLRSDR